MRSVLKELALSIRFLLRSPGITLVATIILSLGLALTMYMFSAIDAYILRPLPFPESQRLVHLEWSNPSEGEDSISVPIHDFLQWREAQRNVESLAGFYQGTINLSGNARPERFDGAYVTSNTLSTLGVKPFLGRLFLPGEDQTEAQPVVILSYDIWRNRYQANPNIIGQTIRVNAQNSIVVGVMPPDFEFPVQEDVWIPFSLDVSKLKRSESVGLEVFGRIREGSTISQVSAEFQSIANRLAQENPAVYKGLVPVVKPYVHEFVGKETRATIYTMFGAVLLVLLIACANVANLTLVRSLARSREFAIRSALGADRWRLMMQVLVECLLVSVIGGLIGYFVADWAGEYTMATLKANPDMVAPYWVTMETDWRTVTFTIFIALFAALLAGLLPAIRASRVDLTKSLHQGGYGSSKPLGRMSRILVTGQITLSCILLISAGLMTRSVLKLGNARVGADIQHVLTGRIGLFETKYPDSDAQIRFYQSLAQRIAILPGVESATISTSLPGTFASSNTIAPENYVPKEGSRLPAAHQVGIAPNYFSSFKAPILKGRAFDSRDRQDGQPVVIVNQLLAEKFWPLQNPIGRRLRLGEVQEKNPWLTVVGVVGNVQQDEVTDEVRPTVYVPIEQNAAQFMSIALRVSGDPMQYAETLRKAVQEVDPDLPVYWIRTLDEWVEISRFGTSFLATLFGAFAVIAIILATAGQYAVLAYSVGQRKREIGIRRALGALDRAVLNLFVTHGLKQFAIALVVGLPLALGFATLISSQLYAVSSFDPVTVVIVSVSLLLASFLAAILPAQRALKVNPAVALRTE